MVVLTAFCLRAAEVPPLPPGQEFRDMRLTLEAE